MAGAVIKVETDLPQRTPSENIELAAAGALGKARPGQCDVTLEHARIAIAHFRAGGADRDGSGDVGGAIQVLAAAVHQVQLPRL